jgi:hypothetical protein
MLTSSHPEGEKLMLRKAAALAICSIFAVGCAYDVDGDDLAEEPVEESELALIMANALSTNALSTNALSTNALSTNALSTNALPADQMSALKDASLDGALARMLVKYLVTCAFSPEQSFTFSWKDSLNLTHYEVYSGDLGLATAWAARGLTEAEQRWVSACITSRVNYYGVTVMISMRGSHSALSVDEAERGAWSFREGAFWGNLFAPAPALYACYDPAQIAHSRSKMRACAAGHWDGLSTSSCGSILRVGSCDSFCVAPSDATDGFSSCGDTTEVVTSFLTP